MVLSDGMVHFLKIKKKFNKSTKTIVDLLNCIIYQHDQY